MVPLVKPASLALLRTRTISMLIHKYVAIAIVQAHSHSSAVLVCGKMGRGTEAQIARAYAASCEELLLYADQEPFLKGRVLKSFRHALMVVNAVN